MRRSTVTNILRSSVALGAIVLGSSAHAACTTANGVVTCTDASTTEQVNDAIRRTPPPSVTIVIAPGATVARSFTFFNGSINPNAPPFNGAIGYTNDGVVGTPDVTVDFLTFGDPANTSNSFTLNNRATQNGGIFAIDMGGSVFATNSGIVTRGIILTSTGPIVFTNTGAVGTTSRFSFDPALTLSSSRFVNTVDADGTQRSTETGGTVTAAIDGTIGLPGSGSTAPRAQDVSVRGVGGVDVEVTGTAGRISADAGGRRSANLFSQTSSGRTTTQTQTSEQRFVGGDARVTITGTGRVGLVNITSQAGTATAIVDGEAGSVGSSSRGQESSFRSISISNNFATPVTSTSTSSTTSVGKAALADISSTGRVSGGVSSFSNAGSATTRIAGVVGDTAGFGLAESTSSGTNTTGQSSSIRRTDGSFESSDSTTQALSGGAALTVVAPSGQALGGASAFGNGSATVTNEGRVRGDVSANSNSFFTPTQSFTSSRSVTNGAAGAQTTVDQTSFAQTSDAGGGTASVTNAAGAIIDGRVQVDGVGGATIASAGTIRDGVFARSIANRSTSTSNNRTTTTSMPATGGGTATTVARESSSTTTERRTGGAVTGIYDGTVGTAPTRTNLTSASISQNATTISTAAITGTVFGSFFGTAGGANVDGTSSSTSNQTTQPNGASARNATNASNQTVSQIGSTSTLTIGATGLITDNSSGPGNVSLVSLGGNAGFTLDGGRVTGSVNVAAAAGENSTQTSTSSSSFTRAAQTSPFIFVPEVQQTQTSVNIFETRAVRGTGSATINAGTIGGDLTVTGTGTGSGTTAASIVVDGTVTGLVSANGVARNTRSSTNDSATRTGPNTVVRTITSSSTVVPLNDGGNVLVSVNGIAGTGIQASSGTGSAMVNLAGRAGTVAANGVSVTAFDFATQRDSTQTSATTNFFSSFPQTASRVTTSSTPTGGAATLNVTPSSALRTSGLSSIEGDVVVNGFSGSTLNVAAGSRLLQTAGSVFVGGNFNTTATDTTGVFTGSVQTGSTGTSSGRFSSGLAAITNAGTIG